jgi:hypothetical protein
MTEAQALVASIRTRVGQIKHAQENPTADSWLRIEIACKKLVEAAASFERSLSSEGDR